MKSAGSTDTGVWKRRGLKFWPSWIGLVLCRGGLVIYGLYFCEFAYSHGQNCSKSAYFLVKKNFLSVNTVFVVQNDYPSNENNEWNLYLLLCYFAFLFDVLIVLVFNTFVKTIYLLFWNSISIVEIDSTNVNLSSVSIL